MTHETNRVPYVEDELGQFRGTDLEMRNGSAGVGLLIVHLETGEILIGEERTGKTIDGQVLRRAGEISLPIETRKEREHVFWNVQAAVLEEVYYRDNGDGNETGFSHQLPNLLFLPGRFEDRSHFIKSAFPAHESGTRADIVILGYQGEKDLLTGNNGDLANIRWASPAEMTGMNNLRTVARSLLATFDPLEESVACIQKDFTAPSAKPIPLFTPDFSQREFIMKRKRLKDVPLVRQSRK